jgi:hypothetical protein
MQTNWVSSGVDGIPDDFVRGEVDAMAKINGVLPARISGYWYGERGVDGKHAQRASPGEKVLYFMHGGFFRAYITVELATEKKDTRWWLYRTWNDNSLNNI